MGSKPKPDPELAKQADIQKKKDLELQKIRLDILRRRQGGSAGAVDQGAETLG